MLKFPFLGIANQSQLDMLPWRDRIAIIAAYFADIEKVHETGANKGFWVEKFLAGVGLGGGYAWCAAFVSFVLKLAHVGGGPKTGRAAVRNWRNWAHDNGHLYHMDKAVRGDLIGYVNEQTGLGHIEICIGPGDTPGYRSSIGGNTNAKGGREGVGVYRKIRPVVDNWFCIKLG